jgi:hypothetical protein
MSTFNSFSSRKFYIDNNVWLIMLLTIIICLGLLGYKVMEKKSCSPFSISARGLLSSEHGKYEIGETVIFSTSLTMDKEVTWDFGDNSDRERSASANMRHKFMNEGNYTVRARINGGCNNELAVQIVKPKNPPAVAEVKNIRIPKIYGDSLPKVGEPVKFLSDIVGSAYEWRIINKSSFPASYEQTASFTFPKAGLYVLQLTVDHDRRKRRLININVSEDMAKVRPTILIPKDIIREQNELRLQRELEKQRIKEEQRLKDEEEAKRKKDEENSQRIKDEEDAKRKRDEEVAKRKRDEEDVKRKRDEEDAKSLKDEKDNQGKIVQNAKKIFIRNEIFQSKLEGVVSGQNDAADFDSYLVNGGETKVLVNNEKKYTTFKELCDEIKGKKKVVIESVQLIRTEDNQVQQIKVKYHKKLL